MRAPRKNLSIHKDTHKLLKVIALFQEETITSLIHRLALKEARRIGEETILQHLASLLPREI